MVTAEMNIGLDLDPGYDEFYWVWIGCGL